jgi:hypothetical protein
VKGSRRYEYRTGTTILGWKTMNSTFVMLTIKEAIKSTYWKWLWNLVLNKRERKTNKLDGQNLNTFVGSFQRLVEVDGEGPQESQNKNTRKQTRDDNAFLKARCEIKVPKTQDCMPALAVSANRHSCWQVQVKFCWLRQGLDNLWSTNQISLITVHSAGTSAPMNDLRLPLAFVWLALAFVGLRVANLVSN